MTVARDTGGDRDADFDGVDPSVSCDACDAVCCRLTVVLMPEDRVPRHLTTRTEHGLEVMARDEEGWCVAVDQHRMCCSIYEQRPAICRKFAMGSAYCRDERATYRAQMANAIPLQLVPPITPG
ncbi:YkgJ family cysteine cluster protein [Luteimonas lutimaris]|uniref:YkgJ family cysteine cluster protein n=1 Tax=Luteimonas lutimaris TaxID=698645 RepID=A0ABP7MCJ9_9GAMM